MGGRLSVTYYKIVLSFCTKTSSLQLGRPMKETNMTFPYFILY